MIKIFALCSAAAAFVVVSMSNTTAEAADLPIYVPPPEPVWSWTGPYAGLHVGAVDGDVENEGFLKLDIGDAEIELRERFPLDPNGIMGGVQAGYNFQFDRIVLGIEGDFSYGDVDDVIYPEIARMEVQIDWMATIRGRLGWTWDRTLFYATGGIAFADMELKAEGLGTTVSDSNTMTGWTIGGGVEHAWTDNISIKAEYLYADFGRKTFTFFDENIGGINLELGSRTDLKTHTFRVGMNWLF